MLRLTLKGVRGHLGRFLLTLSAVTLGIAFVAGSFVLTDSLQSTFDDLIESMAEGVDVTVQGKLVHGLWIDERKDGRGFPYFWLRFGREPRQPLAVGGQLLLELAALAVRLEHGAAAGAAQLPHGRLAVVPRQLAHHLAGAQALGGERQQGRRRPCGLGRG